MIIPASGNSFNQILAEALEREKMERKKESAEQVRMVGEYLVDHAEELYAVAYNDLTGDDIRIHIKRRGGEPCIKDTITFAAETANALRHSVGRAVSHLQNIYEILDAELQGTDFEEDLDKTFRERKSKT